MTLRDEWLAGNATAADERDLFDSGEITECEYEFGPHEDHSDCERMLDDMDADYADDYDDTDYSGWYGGERGYQDGLHWSDFVDGPIYP